MSTSRYFDKSGKEVFFYHEIDGLEALDEGLVTTQVEQKTEPTPQKKSTPEPVATVEDAKPTRSEPRRRKLTNDEEN